MRNISRALRVLLLLLLVAPFARGADDAYSELTGEYEEALDAWRAKRRSAKTLAERRALKGSAPVKAFYPRFEGLYEQGEGHALVWMNDNALEYHDKRSDGKAAKKRMIATLVEKHSSAEWATEIVNAVLGEKTLLGEETLRAHLLKIGDESERPAIAARALARLAQRCAKGGAEDQRRAEGLWERIVREYPQSSPAQEARYSLASLQPPTVPAGALFRPQLVLDDEVLEAGTAFVAAAPEGRGLVVLTAWHLFGPAGGREEQLVAADFGEHVRHARLRGGGAEGPLVAGSLVAGSLVTGPVIVVPEAGATLDGGALAGDIAAFHAPEAARPFALRLSERRPEEGDTLWLLARLRGAGPPERELHRASFLGEEEGSLMFVFEDSDLVLNGASGAAVLDALGEVVGVTWGGDDESESGAVFGYATPVDKFERWLWRAALRTEPLVPPYVLGGLEQEPFRRGHEREVFNVLADGSIVATGDTLYDPLRDDGESDPFRALEARLVSVAVAMDKDHLDRERGTGPMIPDERILIRSAARAPFLTTQRIMESCGTRGIQIAQIDLAVGDAGAPPEDPAEATRDLGLRFPADLPLDFGHDDSDAATADDLEYDDGIEILIRVEGSGAGRSISYQAGARKLADLDALERLLQKIRERGKYWIVIDAPKGVTYGEVVTLLAVLRGAGFTGYSFVGAY